MTATVFIPQIARHTTMGEAGESWGGLTSRWSRLTTVRDCDSPQCAAHRERETVDEPRRL